MLFYSERPRVHPDAGPIALHEKQFVEISIERGKMAAVELYEGDERHKRIKRRIYFEATTDEKTLELDGSIFPVFAEKQARNQEAAQNEEEVDAHPTGRRKILDDSPMIENHQEDGNAPQNIQPLIAHFGGFRSPDGNCLPQVRETLCRCRKGFIWNSGK